MRIFRDLELVEQLGTGIKRILKSYDESVYEFSDYFIRVNFEFKDNSYLPNTPRDIVGSVNKDSIILSETQKKIIKLIKENSRITQKEISEKLDINRTVARNLDVLKKYNVIERIG